MIESIFNSWRLSMVWGHTEESKKNDLFVRAGLYFYFSALLGPSFYSATASREIFFVKLLIWDNGGDGFDISPSPWNNLATMMYLVRFFFGLSFGYVIVGLWSITIFDSHM